MNNNSGEINTQQSTQSIADYLAQLLKDRKQLAAFPNVFTHVERLLDEGKSIFLKFPFNEHFIFVNDYTNNVEYAF
jgi:predicted ester cyclase